MMRGQSTGDATRTNSRNDPSEGGEDMGDISIPKLVSFGCQNGMTCCTRLISEDRRLF